MHPATVQEHGGRRTAKGHPYVYETKETLSLCFNSHSVQSRMRIAAPNELVLPYTQAMMGFLLYNLAPERIALIGLGGGSIAKYCLCHLPNSSIVAVENNLDVLALKAQFCIPANKNRFRVIHADGAHFVQRSRLPKIDVLMLDAFDVYGLPLELCTQSFYNHCFDRLRDGGVLVANFPDTDGQLAKYVARIRESFDDQVVTIEANDNGNKIVFAVKRGDFPPAPAQLRTNAILLNRTHTVNFHSAATKISSRLQCRPTSVINRIITSWPASDFRSLGSNQ